MSAETSSADNRGNLLAGGGFLVLGIALGFGLIAASNLIELLQGGVAGLAGTLALGYAFSAGMVATVNPCGVLLLPTLVAFYLGQTNSDGAGGTRRALKALELGVMATLGFVVLFGLVGLVIGLGGRVLIGIFPIAGLIIGVGLVLLGAWLTLSGRTLGILAAGRAMERVQLADDPRSLFLFGVGYAVTSLSCTLPIFLVVAGSALAAGGPLAAAIQFVSYALGMGTVLTAVILAAAFFQRAVSRTIRRVVPLIHRLAAAFLLGAGIFVVNYWLASGVLSS